MRFGPLCLMAALATTAIFPPVSADEGSTVIEQQACFDQPCAPATEASISGGELVALQTAYRAFLEFFPSGPKIEAYKIDLTCDKEQCVAVFTDKIYRPDPNSISLGNQGDLPQLVVEMSSDGRTVITAHGVR
jgi:hypothetical protein